ncbi:hypothetical protein IJ913_00250 [bacterium]|nr:hypothetical protein [bacterium]
MLIAVILACKGAVFFSNVEIIPSGFRENEISVFLYGIQLFAFRSESIFEDFVLVSMRTLSKLSMNGIKLSLNSEKTSKP